MDEAFEKWPQVPPVLFDLRHAGPPQRREQSGVQEVQFRCLDEPLHFVSMPRADPCLCLDWSFDEDRCRIRTGFGPENTTRLRRFPIQLIKACGLPVAETLRRLNRNVRRVLDFLKMTANTHPRANR